jgi:hypothetical protein
MSQKQNVVAGIKLRAKSPTSLAFGDLFTWTIWQFPRRKAGGLLGAVRPPVAEHGWYPAIIHAKDKRAHVHAHLDATFDSPEAAVDHLNSAK